jgi:hypothetical protein
MQKYANFISFAHILTPRYEIIACLAFYKKRQLDD